LYLLNLKSDISLWVEMHDYLSFPVNMTEQ
jgi:hypothetical protein